MSRASERRNREQYLPASRHEPRPAAPSGPPYVELVFRCEFCNAVLWRFYRLTAPGADTRTAVRAAKRGGQLLLPAGWERDSGKVHTPCFRCRTDHWFSRAAIDAALQAMAENPDGPRRRTVRVK